MSSVSDGHPSLTRYLYSKEGVETSLFLSIIKKKISEAMFWIYELFYSGFFEEAFAIIEKAKNKFDAPINHWKKPKSFNKYYEKKKNLWKTTQNKIILCNLVYNMISHSFEFSNDHVQMRIIDSTPLKYLSFTETHIQKYANYEDRVSDYKHYRVLRDCCLFPICVPQSLTLEEIGQNWLYYASFSPIWKKRLEQYHGSVNTETKKVEFVTEEEEEEFYNRFGYEPDEQSLDIQIKIGLHH
jgi:hypothetical protein